jgi:TM2 domain-containing membrane protein YozV
MSLVRITCPACTRTLEIGAESIGQEVECGACLHVFVAKASSKSTALSSAGIKSPVPRSEESRPGKLAKRRRNQEDYDAEYAPRKRRRNSDDEAEYDDYDPRPSRRGRTDRYREQKSRLAYILLGLFLGSWGVHNFYAGRTGPAVAQLMIHVISIPLICVWVGAFTLWIPIIWSIVDIIVVDRDGNNVPMAD